MKEPNLSHEDLYLRFAEGFIESGDREIPDSWPREVRERCRFFLEVMALSSSLADPEGDGDAGDPLDPTQPGPFPAVPGLPAEEGGEVLRASREGSSRYSIEREIGRGGMGRIILAYDAALRRRIAMKVMRDQDGGRASRFVAEAQATSQLEHPNICPVYDLGIDPEGRIFFTMKFVHGRTLKDVIAAGDQSLTRMVQILQQVAMGVDFAHSRGVIHRDLKPSNIMIGDFGEVLVMDWGLAKVASLKPEGGDGGESPEKVSTDRGETWGMTLDGAVQGSIAYMAPEQARGEIRELDERTDIFGLGAILYEILCGSPPYPEEDPIRALERARRSEIVPPRGRAPHRDIPSALEALCLRALSPRKEDRPRSAREVHDILQGYIEGIHDAERRAADARRLGEAAARRLEEYRAARDEVSALEKGRDQLLASVHDYDSEEEKESLWSLEEDLEESRKRKEGTFREAASTYQAVLNIDPGDRPARSALADLYLERLEEAEARGDPEAAGIYAGLVSHYDGARHAARLKGDGEVAVDSRPQGAAVRLLRFRERGRRLAEEGEETIGETPLRRKLPMGSYLFVLSLPGHREARYPVLIERCGSHSAVVNLYPETSIPPGFFYVPGGPAIVGGESEFFRPLPRHRPWIGDLFVGEFPVTFGEYCAFLNDPEVARREGWEDLIPSFGRERYVAEGPDGEILPFIKSLSEAHRLRCPVFAISAPAALEYCRWQGRRIGRPGLRLLREVEWEKCARGADGRLYPWGNRFDWSFAKGGRSRKGEPYPEPVGRFPGDRSPYGIRDLAGCIREFTADWFAEGFRAVRGGSWFNGFEITFRADLRSYSREGNRVTDLGFRVAFEGVQDMRGGPS